MNLEPEKIIKTTEQLKARIEERFPESTLGSVVSDLHLIAVKASERIRSFSRPISFLRVASWILAGLIVLGLIGSLLALPFNISDFHFFELVQGIEAAINDVILLGAAIFFIVTFENRIKRRRSLRAIHELRVIAHVIDMLQLTKDPTSLLTKDQITVSSPKRSYTPFLLSRYLDYCSEALSLTGKIAAMYVVDFDDPVAISAVNDIEDLTTSLSRKIWQKLVILHGTASGATP